MSSRNLSVPIITAILSLFLLVAAFVVAAGGEDKAVVTPQQAIQVQARVIQSLKARILDQQDHYNAVISEYKRVISEATDIIQAHPDRDLRLKFKELGFDIKTEDESKKKN